MQKFAGIYASLPTPFDWRGDLYPIKIAHNVARWNHVVGLAGYIVGGTAGEANELSRDEKQRVMELAKQAAGEGRGLIAGVGSESLRNSNVLTKAAAELGYQAVLAEPVGREATVVYFQALADRSALPVIISGADAETAVDASQHPNVAAVVAKGSASELVGNVRAGVAVLGGSARDLAGDLQAGAVGAALNYAAALPYSCVTIWEAARHREWDAAADWQRRIAAAVVLIEANVQNLKHALDINGYYGGPPRLPLVPADSAAKQQVEAAMEGLVQHA